MKDLFTGSLGKLNNHGGSKIYTTPNTILVPPEYEIEIGEHGDFISCSLDGRLWLFEDRIIAIKWNATTGKMEYATSKSFSDETFVAHGRDWILTDKSIIQVVDESPYIFHETHDEDVAPMENFYSLVPPLQGFQIVNGYLIRKPNENYENLMYAISTANIYLTFNDNVIWARTPSGIGRVLIIEDKGQYSLDFEYTHSFSDNSWQNMGIAFINDDIFGFKINKNNKTLCPCSEDTQLYSVKNSSWSTLSDKIYFDPFNRSGIIINDSGINLLASEKSIECKGLSQWIAPTNQIQSIDDNAIISSVNGNALATYLNKGFYRGLLPQKSLALTTQIFNHYKLSLGLENNSKINVNGITRNRILIAIKIANPPNKQWFDIGENIDYTGIIIIAEYSDSSIRDVTKECVFSIEQGAIISSGTHTITASYTENKNTKTIILNQLKLEIEVLNTLDANIVYISSYEDYILIYTKIYEKIDDTNWKDPPGMYYGAWTYEQHSIISEAGFFISPETGQCIDFSYSFNEYEIRKTHKSGSSSYHEEGDGEWGSYIAEININSENGNMYAIRKTWNGSINDYHFSNINIVQLSEDFFSFQRVYVNHRRFTCISSIDKESQKIYIYDRNIPNSQTSIIISGLKDLMEEYPYCFIRDYNSTTRTESKGFNVIYLSKGDLNSITNGEWDNEDNIYIQDAIPNPTKIIMLKTKVVPNVIYIR